MESRFTLELNADYLSKLQLLADAHHRTRKAEAEFIIISALDDAKKELAQ